jgi:hypothetical protein
MGFSYIQVREKSLIYRGKIYEYMNFFKNIKIDRQRSLIILDENLYINKVDIKEHKETNEKRVSKVIKESFANCDDFLFNYEVTEDKKTLYIYGVKGGIKISKLCKGASNIKVLPLQILVVNKLKDRIKEKSWQCIFKYMNVYYYCSIIEGLVELTFVQDNINLFNNKFQNLLNEEVLYLDNTINGLDEKGMENFKYIN